MVRAGGEGVVIDDTVGGADGAGEDDLRRAAAEDGLPGGDAAPRDREEEAFEARSGGRAADNRIRRLLRDRHILAAEVKTRDAVIAEQRAAIAKMRAEGFGAELARAEAEAAAAHESGDSTAIARANRRVAEVAASRTAASIEAQSAAREHEEAKRAPPQVPQEPQLSETTAAWLEANPWYGADPRMTRQAQLLDAEAQEEGLRVDSPAYWRYIESQMEGRFPGKVKPLYAQGGGARRGPVPEGDGDGGEAGNGAGAPARRADPALAARVPSSAASGAVMASRGAGPGAPPAASTQAIRLSAEAREAARMLGLTDQQYAARAVALSKQGRVDLRNLTGG